MDKFTVEKLDLYYGSFQALKKIDMKVRANEITALIGPSGCGKSTLLNLVGALDIPTSGAVRFDSRDLGAMDENARADLRARAIGFVFQQHLLLPQCTVLENVLVPTLPLRRSAAERREDAARARALLERVGLSARLDHRPGRLSGANPSAPPSSARSSTDRGCCSPTNRPAPSTRSPRTPSATCWSPSTATKASRSSSSPTAANSPGASPPWPASNTGASPGRQGSRVQGSGFRS